MLKVATKIGQLAQEVSGQNPWWRSEAWAEKDLDLREADETGLNYRPDVLDGLEPGGLYILRGPRRVGKTVAVKHQIQQLIAGGTPANAIVRLAVDDWEAKALRTVTQHAAMPVLPEGVQRTWFLDEISAVTGDWASQIKWLRDNDDAFRQATVVLTGSNATALTEAAGVLAGRRGRVPRVDRNLLPMGFRTFASLISREQLPDLSLPVGGLHTTSAAEAYAQLVPWLGELVILWERYLLYGGFPRAVASASKGENLDDAFIEDLFDVVSGDAFRSSKLSVSKEMALLDRLWEGMASPLNISNVARDIDSTHDIVSRHIAYLRDSYLLWHCPQRADKGYVARESAQDKVYAIDPLVARLPHLRNAARPDIDPTVLNEMQLGLALRRAILKTNPKAIGDAFIFHARTPARKEIDFVAEDLAGTAIEGKYSEDGSWNGEAATVNASQWRGILCTRNVLDTSKGDAAWAVPSAFLAYLIDT